MLKEGIMSNATTEINIDYYEELKRKADMFDEIDEIMNGEKFNLTNFLKVFRENVDYARIGKATEKAFEEGYIICYGIGRHSEKFDIDGIEELLEWAESEGE